MTAQEKPEKMASAGSSSRVEIPNPTYFKWVYENGVLEVEILQPVICSGRKLVYDKNKNTITYTVTIYQRLGWTPIATKTVTVTPDGLMYDGKIVKKTDLLFQIADRAVSLASNNMRNGAASLVETITREIERCITQ
ncbi:hypothetical protein [Metallosphaera sp.]|uniref:hypothetical protein n=1 Tax=Metallosphaera sp. TaxID=2020860 RepID=UPI00316EDE34